MKRRKRYYKYIYGLLVVFIGIGFAYLTANLNINGIGSFGSQSWNIHFDNVVVDNTSYSPDTPTVSDDDLTITFASGLRLPGDYYKFNVDIVNDGSLDAMFDSVNVTANSDFSDYIDYTITYQNGESLAQYDMLPANSSKTITVNFFYKDIDLSDLPTEEMELSFTLEFNYLMANDSVHSVSTFKPGLDVSASMVSLSGTPNDGVPAYVSAFKRSNTLKSGLTNDNIISKSDSDKPIYMWFELNEGEKNLGTIYWYSDAKVVYLNEDSSYFFEYYEDGENFYSIYFSNLEDISGLENVNTSLVKNMECMFDSCENLADISYLSNWDVSNVENMFALFHDANSLSNITALANWNVGNVTDMSIIFFNCNLSDISSLSNWNVSSLSEMSGMFRYTKITDLTPIGNWDVSNVNNMSGLFGYIYDLTDLSPIRNWDTSNVTDMSGMFASCNNLSDLTPISNWNVGSLTSINTIFEYDTKITDATCLNSWNIPSSCDMSWAFSGTGTTSATRPSWYS
ncbi:MAG: BspA family leucine-rich repeat surface protein [Bacilli bacterium]|nr:BspA family leucine-rich repeat surface protein [Bacilli bacterium]